MWEAGQASWKQVLRGKTAEQSYRAKKKKKMPFKSWLRSRAQKDTLGFQLRIHVGSLQDTAEESINEMEDKSVENIDW